MDSIYIGAVVTTAADHEQFFDPAEACVRQDLTPPVKAKHIAELQAKRKSVLGPFLPMTGIISALGVMDVNGQVLGCWIQLCPRTRRHPGGLYQLAPWPLSRGVRRHDQGG